MTTRINLNLALTPKSREQVKQRLELTTARVEAELRSRQTQRSSPAPQAEVVKRVKTLREQNAAIPVSAGGKKRVV